MDESVLTDAELESALAELPGWSRRDDAIVKTFEFADFRAAMAFLVRAGFEAEARDHHPEWTNVYHRVEVRLTTHSAGGKITAKDTDLAAAFERVSAG